jgi:hypothetical protein
MQIQQVYILKTVAHDCVFVYMTSDISQREESMKKKKTLKIHQEEN